MSPQHLKQCLHFSRNIICTEFSNYSDIPTDLSFSWLITWNLDTAPQEKVSQKDSGVSRRLLSQTLGPNSVLPLCGDFTATLCIVLSLINLSIVQNYQQFLLCCGIIPGNILHLILIQSILHYLNVKSSYTFKPKEEALKY